LVPPTYHMDTDAFCSEAFTHKLIFVGFGLEFALPRTRKGGGFGWVRSGHLYSRAPAPILYAMVTVSEKLSIHPVRRPDPIVAVTSRRNHFRSLQDTRRWTASGVERRLCLEFMNANVRDVVFQVTSERLRPVSADGNGLRIHAFVPSPKASEGETFLTFISQSDHPPIAAR